MLCCRTVVGVAILLPAALTASGQMSFIRMGRPAGGLDAPVLALSGDGSTVVGNLGDFRDGDAYRWTQLDGFVPIPRTSAFRESARSVNGDGSVVGGTARYPDSSTSAAISTNGGAFQAVQPTAVDDFIDLGDAEVTAFNSSGTRYLGSKLDSAAGRRDSFVIDRTQNTVRQVNFPDWVTDLSRDGQRVVGQLNNGTPASNLYYFNEATNFTVPVPILPGGIPAAYEFVGTPHFAASKDVIVSSVVNGWTHISGLLLWTPGEGARIIPAPGQTYLYAAGASPDGSIILATDFAANRAMVWTETMGFRTLRDLLVSGGVDLTGWTLQSLRDVSDDGLTVVGYGINPEGLPEGFVAHIPAPGGVVIPLVLGLAARRRR